VGSILVGDAATMKKARRTRKAIGGGLRQPGFIAAVAQVAARETFGGGWLQKSRRTAKTVEQMWKTIDGTTRYPVEANVVWLSLEDAGISLGRFDEIGEEEGLEPRSKRLLIHYQIYQNESNIIPRLDKVSHKAWKEIVSTHRV
jgi:threonine aldolase